MKSTLDSVRPDLPQIHGPLPGPVRGRSSSGIKKSFRPRTRALILWLPAAVREPSSRTSMATVFSISTQASPSSPPATAIPKWSRRSSGRPRELVHMSGTDFYYENMVALAEKLAALAPGDGERRVSFGNSGAEAIEAALKLARYSTGREKFIAFLGAFHGRTLGSLSLTASKPMQRRKFSPLMPGVHHIPYAYCYRCAYGKSPDTCGVECAKVIEDQLVKTILPADEVAAIVLEPVQGEGGYVVPPQKFFDELARIAKRFGMLLVFDEVQSGMGRTGKMWAAEHFNASPDILAVAKGIASGLPLGATVARAELMTWPPGAHASTFGGNPVACAAALVTIELLEKELVANAARIGGISWTGCANGRRVSRWSARSAAWG